MKGVQRYECKVCGRQFVGGTRIEIDELWQDYAKGKQTLTQLAARYGCSVGTIRRRLDKVKVKTVESGGEPGPKKVVIVMDTTYFGRDFGVLPVVDAHRGKMLHREFVKYETNDLCERSVNGLKEQGFEIAAIVCDGRKGLYHLFENIPIQTCQFHQTAIITRYLTRKPKILTSRELRELTLTPRADRQADLF